MMTPIVVRFAPSVGPDKELHLGHIYCIAANLAYIKRFGGRFFHLANSCIESHSRVDQPPALDRKPFFYDSDYLDFFRVPCHSEHPMDADFRAIQTAASPASMRIIGQLQIIHPAPVISTLLAGPLLRVPRNSDPRDTLVAIDRHVGTTDIIRGNQCPANEVHHDERFRHWRIPALKNEKGEVMSQTLANGACTLRRLWGDGEDRSIHHLILAAFLLACRVLSGRPFEEIAEGSGWVDQFDLHPLCHGGVDPARFLVTDDEWKQARSLSNSSDDPAAILARMGMR